MNKNCIIIDDENLARDNIKILLESYSDIEVIGEAGNVLEAIKLYNTHLPGLVFLDINMPNGSGFDFLECVQTDKTKVIFVTAHDDFAIKAIKFNVFDYLVKPIDIDIFEDTINRFLYVDDSLPKQQITTEETHPSKKISFSTLEEIVYLDMDDILYCQSDNSYCNIYTTNEESILISSSLQKVQEKLDDNFFRSHQSYLINKKEIVKYLKLENKILLSNGVKIPVSKKNKKELMNLF